MNRFWGHSFDNFCFFIFTRTAILPIQKQFPVVVRFRRNISNSFQTLVEFLLYRRPVGIRVCVVARVQHHFFHRPQIVHNALDSTFRNGNKICARLRVLNILSISAFQRTKAYRYRVTARIVRRTVNPHTGRNFFELFRQIGTVPSQLIQSIRCRSVILYRHCHEKTILSRSKWHEIL